MRTLLLTCLLLFSLNAAHAQSVRKASDAMSVKDSLQKIKDALPGIERITRSMAGKEPSADKYERRGYAKAVSGDHRGALEDYSMALKLGPVEARTLYNRALAYINMQQFPKAYADLTAAIEADSSYASAWADRGALLSETGKHKEALPDFTQAINLEPNYFNAWYNRGYTYVQLNRYAEALEDLAHAETLMTGKNADEEVAKLFFYRGVALQKTNHPEEALRSYNTAISRYVGDPVYFFNRAGLLADLHQDDAALKDYDYLVRIHPDDPKTYHSKGLWLLELGRAEEAKTNFDKAIRLGLREAEVYNFRANANRLLKDYPAALKDYDRSVSLDSTYYSARLNRASLLEVMGDTLASLDAYRELIRRAPDSAVTYHNRGLLRKKMGNYKGALKDFDKAILLNPNLHQAYTQRGDVHYLLGNNEAAMDDYGKAIVLAPEEALAYWRRGDVQQNAGNKQAALADLQQAVALDTGGKYPQAMLGLAGLEQQLGMSKAAMVHYRAYLKNHESESSQIYSNMGFVMLEDGVDSKALELFEQSIQFNKNNADGLLGMAMANYQLGNESTVKSALKKAIAKEPRLASGMPGIKEMEQDGYFYTAKQKKILKALFGMMMQGE